MRAERHGVRSRGQGVLTAVVLVAVVGGGVALQRGLGPRPDAGVASASVRSGAWLCPHGGGAKRWTATLYLANPGTGAVFARITSLSQRRRGTPQGVSVPAQSTVAVPVSALGREASTYVEYFGGWVAAGWVTHGGGGEIGVAAEPCAPAAGRTWYSPDGTTQQGEDAYLVVMNPFAGDAIFDVVLLTPGRAPIRSSKLTDVVLHPGRSIAIRLNAYAEGEAAVAAEVDVSLGRVAASSLGISRAGGIRSAIAQTTAAPQAYLPVGAGAGQSTLVVMVPGADDLHLAATVLSGNGSAPAGGLTEASVGQVSAHVYPVTTSGPGSIDVVATGSVPFVASQRAEGVGNDDAATGGATAAATDWVVLPATAGEPAKPGLVIVNPGDGAARVTLHALAASGRTPPPDVTFSVPAGSTIQAPAGFIDDVLDGAVEVRSEGGAVIAMADSTSLGVKGISTYALSMGVTPPSP